MSNGSKDNVSKLESIESKLATGLDQINEDIGDLEHEEEDSSKYVDNLNSLSQEQVEALENGLETETFQGRKILKKLEKSLGMEEESVKTLAQIVHRIDDSNKEIKDKEEEIDMMLENLHEKAENGKVDEELAGKCLAEIMAVKDEIKETSDLEEETSEVSKRLEEDLSESHQELVEMKRDEIELENEMESTEDWARNNDINEMQRFVDQEGSPNLVSEIQELKNEIREQQRDETEFIENMARLAEDEKLTERQIDHLITQQQEWSTVAKQFVKDGGSGFKKIGDALFGFTPMGVAMGATKGAAQEINKKQVMNAVEKVSRRLRGTAMDTESEVEASIQETQSAKDRLKQAKG